MRYDSPLRCRHCMHCHSPPSARSLQGLFWLHCRHSQRDPVARVIPCQVGNIASRQTFSGQTTGPCATPLQASHACRVTDAHATIDSPLCMRSPQGLLGFRCQHSEKDICCCQEKICQVGITLLRQPSLLGRSTGLATIPCVEACMHSDLSTC